MAAMKKAVYLDQCALARPFDDQSFWRIRLETNAVSLILENIRKGNYKLYYSPVHEEETNAITNAYIRNSLRDVYVKVGDDGSIHIAPEKAEARAEQLVKKGFGIADAAHVAYAEALNATFITCDDKLIKLCRRETVSVWCGTPVAFCEKEGLR